MRTALMQNYIYTKPIAEIYTQKIDEPQVFDIRE